MCHSRQANFALTMNEGQLNRGEQLLQWERLGFFRVDSVAFERDRLGREKSPPLFAQATDQREPRTATLLPRGSERLGHFATASDEHATLEKRARSYLATNCAHCHTLYGGGNSAIDFDWLFPLAETHAIGERPVHGDFGLADARIISPGAPERSILLLRVSTRGSGQMPPVCTHAPDPDGIRLLTEWIQSMPR